MWALKGCNCECCGRDFVSPTALKYHFRWKHIGKAPCQECGQEILREKLEEHTKFVHDRLTTEIHELNWKNLEERSTKHMVRKISNTCRMCSKCFGTVLTRENHEIQEHHFTANKRAQMCTGFSPHNMLECKSSQELQRFADKNIRTAFGLLRLETRALIEQIQACFPVSASGVIQGGSYIKGTDIWKSSEIQVVLFSDAFASGNNCKEQLSEGMGVLRKKLKGTSYGNSHIILRLFSDKGLYAVQLEKKNDVKRHLYRKLYFCNDREEAELCALTLLPFRVNFVKASIVRVKDLVRLMTHWFKISFANTTEENKPFILDPVNPTVNVCDTCNAWDEVAHVARQSLLKPLFIGVRAKSPWLFTDSW